MDKSLRFLVPISSVIEWAEGIYPPGADTRPAQPGFAPPLPRSRGAAHLHQWLPVSPVPTPGSSASSAKTRGFHTQLDEGPETP